jgi:NRPS condensation-like uncharacterized protein
MSNHGKNSSQFLRHLGRWETAAAITDSCKPFNVVASLSLSNGPAIQHVKDALEKIQHHYPALNIRLLRYKKRYYFEKGDIPPIPFNSVKKENQEDLQKVVDKELNTKIDSETGPLLRCTCLHQSSAKGDVLTDVVVSFHHTIVDAVSGNYFLHHLLSLISARGKDASEKVLSEIKLKPPAEKSFPSRYRGLRLFKDLILFFFRQMADEISYRIKTRKHPPLKIDMSTQCFTIPMTISRELTKALIKRSRQERVTIYNTLLLAQIKAVQKFLYDEAEIPYRIFTFADLRPYLDPPVDDQYLAPYISMLRFGYSLDNHSDFWSLVRKLNSQILKAYKRGDKFIFYLMSDKIMKMMARMQSQRMATIALSYSSHVSLNLRYGPIGVEELHAYVSNLGFGPEFCAQARLFSGRLGIDFICLASDMDHSLATKISQEMHSILEKAVEVN